MHLHDVLAGDLIQVLAAKSGQEVVLQKTDIRYPAALVAFDVRKVLLFNECGEGGDGSGLRVVGIAKEGMAGGNVLWLI